jgi:phage-related protein
MLLTFKNIRNEAGAGNDIFNQSVSVLNDMSSAMGKDMKSSAIQLGKALNDPIQGMTALRRVGVSFSEDQVNLITRLQKSGDVLGAQKVILKELNTEFGGAAAASTDFGAKALNAWHNLQEELGGLVLPVISKVATYFATVFVPAILGMVEAFRTGESSGRGLAGLFGHIGAAAGAIIGGFRDGRKETEGFRGAFYTLGSNIRTLFDYVRSAVMPVLHEFGDGVASASEWLFGASRNAGLLRSALAGILGAYIAVTAATRAWTIAQTALDIALNANWIALVVLAIGALVAGVIYAWQHFSAFRTVVEDTWHGIVAAALWAWHNVLKPTFDGLVVAGQAVGAAALWLWHNVLEPAWQAIAAVVSWAWGNVIFPAFQAFNLVMSAIGTVALFLWHNVIEPVWRGISAAISVAWTILRPVFMLIGAFLGILGDIFMFFWHNIVEPVWHGIVFAAQVAAVILKVIWVAIEIGVKIVQMAFRVLWDVVQFVWGAIKGAIQVAWIFIKPIWDAIVAVINAVVIPAFKELWREVQVVWGAISTVIAAVWNGAIKPVFDAFGNFIRDHVEPAFRGGIHGIEVAWNLIKDIAKKPVNFVINVLNNGFVHPFNSLAGFFGVKDRVPDIPQLATGGLFRGERPGRDTNLAWLTDEEFVVNPVSTRRHRPLLEWLNTEGRRNGALSSKYPGDLSQGIPGFADGGFVGWLSSIGKGIWDAITDPGKFIGDLANKLLANIPGGELLRDIIRGGVHKLVNWLVGWVNGQGGGSGTPASLGAVYNLLHSMIGTPYRWAGASRFGVDCSGAVSIAYNALRGRDLFQHTFSTSDEARYFPLSGVGGLLTAGWTNPGESGPGGGPNGVGHTAGLLGGMNGIKFESTGSTGFRMGDAVTPISAFAHVGHYDRGGLWPSDTYGVNASGRTEYVASADAMDRVIALLEALIEAVQRVAPDFGAHMRGVSRATLQAARAR